MRLAHFRTRNAGNRAETLKPLRGIDMRSRCRHQLRLALVLAKLLQQHAVAGFETQRVEQVAQISERLGQTLCASGFVALLVARP